MVVLRSRDVPVSIVKPSLPKTASANEPLTPTRTLDFAVAAASPYSSSLPQTPSSTVRRNHRLAPKKTLISCRNRKRKSVTRNLIVEEETGNSIAANGSVQDHNDKDKDNFSSRTLNLRSGKKVVKKKEAIDSNVSDKVTVSGEAINVNDVLVVENHVDGEIGDCGGNGGEIGDCGGNGDSELKESKSVNEGVTLRGRRRSYRIEEKCKSKLVGEGKDGVYSSIDISVNDVLVAENSIDVKVVDYGGGKMNKEDGDDKLEHAGANEGVLSRRGSFRKEDKGKSKLVDGAIEIVENCVEDRNGERGARKGDGEDGHFENKLKDCPPLHGKRKKYSIEEKGKKKLVDDPPLVSRNGVGDERRECRENTGVEESKAPLVNNGKRKKYSRDEKGKEKLVDEGLCDMENLVQLESEVTGVVNGMVEGVNVTNQSSVNVGYQSGRENTGESVSRMGQFRDIARKNASRFAHFVSQEEQEQVEVEEEQRMEEDWPGPFSTAMKIIRDRENKINSQQVATCMEKVKSVLIKWTPKSNESVGSRKARVPSLQELSMNSLAQNADAITSLDYVPDSLRHRLCQLLCDTRRMNNHFLDLLVRDSPVEIRIADCSFLKEEEFSKCFLGCNTNNLMVLQLDQCGNCLPDYIVVSTLARSPVCLPALTTLSLSGAYRLSDVGLNSIVSSAPALQSLNLSHCSLLTAASIDTLSNTLGTVIRELYIDDCQNIDAMLILPALKKLEHLEVLSLAGIQTVRDKFIRDFVVARGHNLKELVLSDCVKLTDSSLKIIAEKCSKLCMLNLSNLRKLTDSSLQYLANGCLAIESIKLRQNEFSDEAVAAYLEIAGETLKELSLNSVKMVDRNTALSIARHAKRLQSLDLSWCRNLPDEAFGLIVDSCLSLRILKVFGCTQITSLFLHGHSNVEVEIVGMKLSPVLENLRLPIVQELTS